jgi:hypothetical protein
MKTPRGTDSTEFATGGRYLPDEGVAYLQGYLDVQNNVGWAEDYDSWNELRQQNYEDGRQLYYTIRGRLRLNGNTEANWLRLRNS